MSEGFLELKLLVREVIEGKIQINKPIIITNSDRTNIEELSFLSHVLKYNNVKKDTMFVFLNEILDVFNKQMGRLMGNSNVQKYIDNVKNDWDDLSDILFKEIFSEDQVKLMESLIENITPNKIKKLIVMNKLFFDSSSTTAVTKCIPPILETQ
jgi:hypothetical protein